MRSRVAELEFLRAIAAIAVVLIHVTAGLMLSLPVGSRSFFYYSLINQWGRFSIPAFVIITGIVLGLGYGQRSDFRLGQYLLRRLQSIGLPYLVWTILYLLWRARIERTWEQLPALLGPALLQGNAMYQLYFVVLIFQFYLLFPLIRPLVKSRWLGLVLLLVLILQGVLMWDTYYGLFSQHLTAPWARGILRWRDRLFLWWLAYFFVGIWLSTHLEQILSLARRLLWPLMALSAGLLAWMMVEYMQVMSNGGSVGFAATGFRPTAYLYALVASVALLGWGRWMTQRDGYTSRLWLAVGSRSFGIFLVHPFVLDITHRLLRSWGLSPLLYLVVVSSIVLVGSYLLSKLLSALPFGRWIVGN